jgi:hypothetical protein
MHLKKKIDSNRGCLVTVRRLPLFVLNVILYGCTRKEDRRIGRGSLIMEGSGGMRFDGTCISKFSDIIGVKIDGKWGLIHKSGRKVMSPRYDSMTHFYGDWAEVGQGGKWGVIDQAGQEVVPLRCDVVGKFLEGLAEVSIDDKWGYVDTRGQEVVPLCYEYAGRFVDGAASVELDGKWGFIDGSGQVK